MKKLLVLALVLAVSVVASATTVSLEQPVIAEPVGVGSTYVININSDAGLYGLNALISVVGGDAVITAASGVADAAAFGWDATLSFVPAGVGTAAAEIGLGTFGAPPSGTVASVTVEVTGLTEDVVIAITPAANFGGSADAGFAAPDFSAANVVIPVPEPITVALLGLGGLFIRRRK